MLRGFAFRKRYWPKGRGHCPLGRGRRCSGAVPTYSAKYPLPIPPCRFFSAGKRDSFKKLERDWGFSCSLELWVRAVFRTGSFDEPLLQHNSRLDTDFKKRNADAADRFAVTREIVRGRIYDFSRGFERSPRRIDFDGDRCARREGIVHVHIAAEKT